ncbi:MAG: NAD(P)/FAD-dependent oxidoreductase [Ruminococcaceae bacterium]|nr:NAD(P)/FAD-dependent oxidoreductase [Oscillospiraceae bacterium]
MIADVVVIGGGPAGLMAAGVASQNGRKTVLIEKNSILGKKLLITGKGRCNVTNGADISEFFDFIVKNPRFLYSAFYNFTNLDVINFFEDKGIKLKEERGKRIFPVSDRSNDILTGLKKHIKDVTVIHGKATGLVIEENAVKGVSLSDGTVIGCESVVLATGGVSYPLTGSTGEGHKLAKKHGHSVTELKPALVPLVLYGKYPKLLEGLSLRNISVKLYDENKKELYSDFGEMLFTKNGVSGPVILSMSSFVEDNKKMTLSIDLKPALDEEKLEKRILSDFEKFANKNFSNSLNELLPKKLIPVVVELSGINPDTKVNQITRAERKTLVGLLKNLSFEIKSKGDIEEAIITDGGISVKEINPKTMESKIINGLFFAGEIIDVHGYTGGFNLQIAFSTGYTAGMNC